MLFGNIEQFLVGKSWKYDAQGRYLDSSSRHTFDIFAKALLFTISRIDNLLDERHDLRCDLDVGWNLKTFGTGVGEHKRLFPIVLYPAHARQTAFVQGAADQFLIWVRLWGSHRRCDCLRWWLDRRLCRRWLWRDDG